MGSVQDSLSVMAWIETKPGGHIGRYRVEGRTRSTTVFKRKTDAREAAERLEREGKVGQWVDPKKGRILLRDWAPRWLDSLEVAAKTRHGYAELLGSLILPTWGSTPLSLIELSAVKRWVSTMRGARGGEISDARRKAAGAQLLRILDAAVDEGILTKNPARTLSGKATYLPSAKRKKAHRYLTHGELEVLASAAGDQGTLLRFAGYTGLRWGEITALRVSDVDPLRCRVTVGRAYSIVGGKKVLGDTKTHERRTLTMPRFLAEPVAALGAGKQPDDLLFATVKGEPFDNSNFMRRVLGPSAQAAGIERLTFHDLRHTAASLAVQAGGNVKTVQHMMGHASATMTLDTYAGLFDEDAQVLADRMEQAREQALSGGSAHYLPTEPTRIGSPRARQRA